MRCTYLILILFFGCIPKKQIKGIEVPFKILIPGYFDIGTDPDRNRFIEVITKLNDNITSIQISIRDSINPNAYYFFDIAGKNSSSFKIFKIGDTTYSESSDGISKYIEKNGNIVWIKEDATTERVTYFYYHGDTLLEYQFQKKGNEIHLKFENEYLFSKNNQMIYSAGMQKNTFLYYYNLDNNIIEIDELGNNSERLGYKKIEYFKNAIFITSYLSDKIEETDSVYLDSFGRILKKVTNTFDSRVRTKYYFYDSLDPQSLSKINAEIFHLINAVNKKSK